MDDRRIDILGDSLELPEDLSALTGEFPTVPSILPDELRGALLLPSDSSTSGSFSEGRIGDDSSLEDLIQRTMGSQSSLKGSSTKQEYGNEAPPSVRSVSEDLHMSQTSSHPSVGLSGVSVANVTPDSLGQSHSFKSKSDKSRDWSLSDTDLKELLDKGNDFDCVTPLASSLVMVPETHEFSTGNSIAKASPGKPRNELLHGGVSSLSSPSQSCSHETSGSKSVVTNWSSGTRHSAVMSSSISTIGGRAAHATNIDGREANDDILESSITSADSNLL